MVEEVIARRRADVLAADVGGQLSHVSHVAYSSRHPPLHLAELDASSAATSAAAAATTGRAAATRSAAQAADSRLVAITDAGHAGRPVTAAKIFRSRRIPIEEVRVYGYILCI